MYAPTLLHKTLGERCTQIHASRLNTCWLAVQSLTEGARATVTSLGRGLSGNAYDKHKIKRVDRLLSNSLLHLELRRLYSALAHALLRSLPKPIIHIDWSPLCADQSWQLLRAAVPVGGRTLTLYEEVHPRNKLGNRKTQHRFLSELADLIPPHCRPTVVADSGFKTPFYRYVEQTLGWHWVGRIRSRDFICFDGVPDQWLGAKTLYEQATTRPKDLGHADWVRSNPLASRLVLIRQTRKRRCDLTYAGNARQSKRSHSHASREREPWLLVCSTSLDELTARQVVCIYQSRMQIEEAFRDCKSALMGLGLSRHRSTSINRRTVLCLLTTLAHFVLWCVGMAGKDTAQARRVRVNSSSKRAPYSTIFMGRLLIAQRRFRLPDKLVQRAIHQVKASMEAVLQC